MPPFLSLMAIDRSIKRSVGKDGRVRFYQYGKQIPYKKGVSKFFKQNEKKIQEFGDKAIPKITDKERNSLRRSQAAKNRYFFDDGKGKRKYVDKDYVKILQKYKFPNLDFKERNLAKYKSPVSKKTMFRRYTDIERSVSNELLTDPDIFKEFTASKGRFKSKQTGQVEPRIQSLSDIADMIGKDSIFKNFRVSFIDLDGEEVVGRRKTMQFIVDFERSIMNQTTDFMKNLGMLVRFIYKPIIRLKKKEIIFDFTDTTDETYLESLAVEANKSRVKQTQEGGITIDKYKGVIVELDFS